LNYNSKIGQFTVDWTVNTWLRRLGSVKQMRNFF